MWWEDLVPAAVSGFAMRGYSKPELSISSARVEAVVGCSWCNGDIDLPWPFLIPEGHGASFPQRSSCPSCAMPWGEIELSFERACIDSQLPFLISDNSFTSSSTTQNRCVLTGNAPFVVTSSKQRESTSAMSTRDMTARILLGESMRTHEGWAFCLYSRSRWIRREARAWWRVMLDVASKRSFGLWSSTAGGWMIGCASADVEGGCMISQSSSAAVVCS
mmetsp:Transcript_16593/g.29245  ORF Transcript_16593/g.29245 Transcript_16593/m.29245 type:complete len:219 (-) Transcript_16593:823-1479(-)